MKAKPFEFDCPECRDTVVAMPPVKAKDEIECPTCRRTITVPRKPILLKVLTVSVLLLAFLGTAVWLSLPVLKSMLEKAEAETAEGQSTGRLLPVKNPFSKAEKKPAAPSEQELREAEKQLNAIQPGMSRAEVFRILGRPTSMYGSGTSTFLVYEGAEVILERGLVSEVIARNQPR